jgi:2'-5' RNA ligase
MPPLTGLYVIAELTGTVGEQIRRVQLEFDTRLARQLIPHITIVGSSGMGPIRPDVPVEELRERLAPIAAATPPMLLRFEPPMRFMQTTVVVLPLSPHGPLRALHEAIKASGLPYARPRFTFSPHATLSLYRELTPAIERKLLAVRIDDPVRIDRITVTETRDPLPPRNLLELPLGTVEEGASFVVRGEAGRGGPPPTSS